MDSRKLLTFIYILKAVVKGLKNYVRSHQDKIIKVIMNLVKVIEDVDNNLSNG